MENQIRIRIYRDVFDTGKFNYDCSECSEVLGTRGTPLAATNSAMTHNNDKHRNTLQIHVCNCEECALAIYQLYLAEYQLYIAEYENL